MWHIPAAELNNFYEFKYEMTHLYRSHSISILDGYNDDKMMFRVAATSATSIV